MSKPTKNAKKSTQFQPGNPGGPGRPVGSRNKATVLLDQIAEGEGNAVVSRVLASAKEGDMRAAEIVLSRIWPIRKGRPVTLDLPKVNTPADILAALGEVCSSVAAGVITPDEGQALSNVLELKRRAIETADLETRIKALEQRK